jgi:hypothetical protein
MICQCGTDISDPLRQFGPREEPLCWDCYSGEVLPEDEERKSPTTWQPWITIPKLTRLWRMPAQEAGRQ